MTYPRAARLSSVTAKRVDVIGSDDVLVWTGRTTRTDNAVPFIYCHGVLGSASTAAYRDNALGADDLRPIAAWGHPVLVPDLGGPSTWGNDTSIDAVDDTVTWAASNLGTRTDLVALGGESMGALTALNWAWRNPTKVAAIWLRVPCVALETTHDTDASFTGPIDSAYTNHAGYLAALPTHDPMANLDLIRPFGDRIRAWCATSDEFFLPAEVREFGRQVGAKVDEIPGTHAAGFDTPALEVAAWVDRTIRSALRAA